MADLIDQMEHVRGRRAGMRDDEVGVTVRDLGPAVAGSLETSLFDQRPGGKVGADVLEDAARRLVTVRLVLLLDDPDASHPLDDSFGILRVQLELRGEDQRLVETVPAATGDRQLVAFADLDLVCGVDDRGAPDILTNRALPAAGIASQSAADGAGNAREAFEAGQSRPRRLGNQGGQRYGRADGDDPIGDTDVGERRTFQMDDQRLDPFVPDKDVGATAEDLVGQPGFTTTVDQAEHLVEGARTGQEGGRAAESKPDVRGQRLSRPDDRTKVVE